VRLVAFGPHLATRFGRTDLAIQADGAPIDERVECLLDSDTDVGMAKSLGLATLGLADCLGRLRPDLVLVPADRYEMLAAAGVATTLRIPIVHLEGGEITGGAIDDGVRRAITALASIHLTTTARARERVIASGEEAWRVHHVGAPSLDTLRSVNLEPPDAILSRLGFSPHAPPVLVAVHPVTLDPDPVRDARVLLAALARFPDIPLAFCHANADAQRDEIMSLVRAFCQQRTAARLFVNLDRASYWSLLGASRAIAGNSSSGVMESTSLGVPAVDVGERQAGRERAANVLHAGADEDAIAARLAEAMAMRPDRAPFANTDPYGDGRASERIAEIIEGAPPAPRLLRKHRG